MIKSTLSWRIIYKTIRTTFLQIDSFNFTFLSRHKNKYNSIDKIAI